MIGNIWRESEIQYFKIFTSKFFSASSVYVFICEWVLFPVD